MNNGLTPPPRKKPPPAAMAPSPVIALRDYVMLLPAVLDYLALDDYTRMQQTTKRWYTTLKVRKKKSLRERGVVPAAKRLRFWEFCAGVHLLFSGEDALQFEYEKALGGRRGKAALSSDGIEGEILRDVSRTFPKMEYFSATTTTATTTTTTTTSAEGEPIGRSLTPSSHSSNASVNTADDVLGSSSSSSVSSPGQDSLANVLRAVANHIPGVNYCQGMNYVAAVVLLEARRMEERGGETSGGDGTDISRMRLMSLMQRGTSEERAVFRQESRAFGLMCGFITNLDMKDLWRPGVPQLKLRIFQFDRLLHALLPSLWHHFRSVNLSPDFFASQWFLTLMSYNITRRESLVLLHDGWKTIFRVGIAMLGNLESRLLKMPLEELAAFLKQEKFNFLGEGGEETMRNALGMKGVSTAGLVELENQYVSHVLAQQLSKSPDVHGSVAFIDRRVARFVREEISKLDMPARTDVSVLRNKIELAEKALRRAREDFYAVARDFVEVQADVEELQEAKRAILNQMNALVTVTGVRGGNEGGGGDSGGEEGVEVETRVGPDPERRRDFVILQRKIEAVETQLFQEAARFGNILWQTTQAQIDLEEALERKSVFSEQLRTLVANNEAARSERMKSLFREIGGGVRRRSGDGSNNGEEESSATSTPNGSPSSTS